MALLHQSTEVMLHQSSDTHRRFCYTEEESNRRAPPGKGPVVKHKRLFCYLCLIWGSIAASILVLGTQA
jgi:hypothetical protein